MASPLSQVAGTLASGTDVRSSMHALVTALGQTAGDGAPSSAGGRAAVGAAIDTAVVIERRRWQDEFAQLQRDMDAKLRTAVRGAVAEERARLVLAQRMAPAAALRGTGRPASMVDVDMLERGGGGTMSRDGRTGGDGSASVDDVPGTPRTPAKRAGHSRDRWAARLPSATRGAGPIGAGAPSRLPGSGRKSCSHVATTTQPPSSPSTRGVGGNPARHVAGVAANMVEARQGTAGAPHAGGVNVDGGSEAANSSWMAEGDGKGGGGGTGAGGLVAMAAALRAEGRRVQAGWSLHLDAVWRHVTGVIVNMVDLRRAVMMARRCGATAHEAAPMWLATGAGPRASSGISVPSQVVEEAVAAVAACRRQLVRSVDMVVRAMHAAYGGGAGRDAGDMADQWRRCVADLVEVVCDAGGEEGRADGMVHEPISPPPADKGDMEVAVAAAVEECEVRHALEVTALLEHHRHQLQDMSRQHMDQLAAVRGSATAASNSDAARLEAVIAQLKTEVAEREWSVAGWQRECARHEAAARDVHALHNELEAERVQQAGLRDQLRAAQREAGATVAAMHGCLALLHGTAPLASIVVRDGDGTAEGEEVWRSVRVAMAQLEQACADAANDRVMLRELAASAHREVAKVRWQRERAAKNADDASDATTMLKHRTGVEGGRESGLGVEVGHEQGPANAGHMGLGGSAAAAAWPRTRHDDLAREHNECAATIATLQAQLAEACDRVVAAEMQLAAAGTPPQEGDDGHAPSTRAASPEPDAPNMATTSSMISTNTAWAVGGHHALPAHTEADVARLRTAVQTLEATVATLQASLREQQAEREEAEAGRAAAEAECHTVRARLAALQPATVRRDTATATGVPTPPVHVTAPWRGVKCCHVHVRPAALHAVPLPCATLAMAPASPCQSDEVQALMQVAEEVDGLRRSVARVAGALGCGGLVDEGAAGTRIRADSPPPAAAGPLIATIHGGLTGMRSVVQQIWVRAAAMRGGGMPGPAYTLTGVPPRGTDAPDAMTVADADARTLREEIAGLEEMMSQQAALHQRQLDLLEERVAAAQAAREEEFVRQLRAVGEVWQARMRRLTQQHSVAMAAACTRLQHAQVKWAADDDRRPSDARNGGHAATDMGGVEHGDGGEAHTPAPGPDPTRTPHRGAPTHTPAWQPLTAAPPSITPSRAAPRATTATATLPLADTALHLAELDHPTPLSTSAPPAVSRSSDAGVPGGWATVAVAEATRRWPGDGFVAGDTQLGAGADAALAATRAELMASSRATRVHDHTRSRGYAHQYAELTWQLRQAARDVAAAAVDVAETMAASRVHIPHLHPAAALATRPPAPSYPPSTPAPPSPAPRLVAPSPGGAAGGGRVGASSPSFSPPPTIHMGATAPLPHTWTPAAAQHARYDPSIGVVSPTMHTTRDGHGHGDEGTAHRHGAKRSPHRLGTATGGISSRTSSPVISTMSAGGERVMRGRGHAHGVGSEGARRPGPSAAPSPPAAPTVGRTTLAIRPRGGAMAPPDLA